MRFKFSGSKKPLTATLGIGFYTAIYMRHRSSDPFHGEGDMSEITLLGGSHHFVVRNAGLKIIRPYAFQWQIIFFIVQAAKHL